MGPTGIVTHADIVMRAMQSPQKAIDLVRDMLDELNVSTTTTQSLASPEKQGENPISQ